MTKMEGKNKWLTIWGRQRSHFSEEQLAFYKTGEICYSGTLADWWTRTIETLAKARAIHEAVQARETHYQQLEWYFISLLLAAGGWAVIWLITRALWVIGAGLAFCAFALGIAWYSISGWKRLQTIKTVYIKDFKLLLLNTFFETLHSEFAEQEPIQLKVGTPLGNYKDAVTKMELPTGESYPRIETTECSSRWFSGDFTLKNGIHTSFIVEDHRTTQTSYFTPEVRTIVIPSGYKTKLNSKGRYRTSYRLERTITRTKNPKKSKVWYRRTITIVTRASARKFRAVPNAKDARDFTIREQGTNLVIRGKFRTREKAYHMVFDLWLLFSHIRKSCALLRPIKKRKKTRNQSHLNIRKARNLVGIKKQLL
jgi:hypothetical protein